jgi:hypothetical protein
LNAEIVALGKSNIYIGFVLPPFVDKVFSLLKADISLLSQVNIGQYSTQLTYTQLQVPVKTDQSLNLLLRVLARPIVQKIVNGSVLGFDMLTISNATETSFDVSLSANAGREISRMIRSDSNLISFVRLRDS